MLSSRQGDVSIARCSRGSNRPSSLHLDFTRSASYTQAEAYHLQSHFRSGYQYLHYIFKNTFQGLKKNGEQRKEAGRPPGSGPGQAWQDLAERWGLMKDTSRSVGFDGAGDLK